MFCAIVFAFTPRRFRISICCTRGLSMLEPSPRLSLSCVALAPASESGVCLRLILRRSQNLAFVKSLAALALLLLCISRTGVWAQPPAVQTATPANWVVNSLDLARLTVKGPVTLQGVVPFQCTPWPADTRGFFSPCPDIFSANSTPRWAAGDGFAVFDANPSLTFPKIYIANSLVDFQADITFLDDTSAVEVSHAQRSSIKNCSQNSDCLSGACVPTVAAHGQPGPNVCTERTCFDSVLPGALEGNHAHYFLVVQRWDKNATSCRLPQASLDPDYPPVRFDVPSPTGSSASAGGGAKGCWVDLTSGSAELFGSSAGQSSPGVAARDGLVNGQINAIADLPDVSNFLRYVVAISEGDTRVPASTTLTGWAPGRTSPPNTSACDPNQAAPYENALCPLSDTLVRTYFPYCTSPSIDDFYDWTIQHPTSTSHFSYSAALNPFQVVVQPLALVQLKVLPYTLVYQPPGDSSKASFTTTTSFGIGMAVDAKFATNQTTTVDNKGAATAGFGLANFGLGDLLGKTGSISDSFSNATSWDKSTKVGVGSTSDVATNQTANYQTTLSIQVSNQNLVPGASGAYATEPFWSDTFVLLVHPQVGFWKLGGVPVISLLAAVGTPAAPDFFEPTVKDLDDCAKQAAPYVTGIPIPGTSDVLTKDDCNQLLRLDTFYGVGQNPPGLARNARFVRTGGTDYGVDPATSDDLNPTMTQVISYSNSTTVANIGSYTASVTDILGSTGTATFGLGLFGISGSDKLEDTETTTNSTDWTVTLQSSFTATAQSSTTISGNLDDHHGLRGDGSFLPVRPHVEVFQDTLFGSFLFVDPAAPMNPDLAFGPNVTR